MFPQELGKATAKRRATILKPLLEEAGFVIDKVLPFDSNTRLFTLVVPNKPENLDVVVTINTRKVRRQNYYSTTASLEVKIKGEPDKGFVFQPLTLVCSFTVEGLKEIFDERIESALKDAQNCEMYKKSLI